MNLGDKLLELRKKKGLSQEDVAFELSVTRQTISKWETNQTTPDFDKIAPLCKLYEISTDELLTGKTKDKINVEEIDVKKRGALVLAVSIFLYFLSIIWIIISEETFHINEGITIGIFFAIIAVATCLIVYHFTSLPKKEKTETEKRDNKLLKQIQSIVSSIILVIYLLVSFLTMAWHITWILWIVDAIICEIVKLIFILKGDINDEE